MVTAGLRDHFHGHFVIIIFVVVIRPYPFTRAIQLAQFGRGIRSVDVDGGRGRYAQTGRNGGAGPPQTDDFRGKGGTDAFGQILFRGEFGFGEVA